jgi:hypothetical protein
MVGKGESDRKVERLERKSEAKSQGQTGDTSPLEDHVSHKKTT